ncbi:hypothetical protein NL108_014933 [Boleophthalmus pectinirostris]|nr:hypothetical protein NL108_014933 [Boleophthalmus pectinirostris]
MPRAARPSGPPSVSEGLLQCRTQQWSLCPTTQERREGERKRRERGREGKNGGGGCKSRHIIVTHQPKGSNKERHAVLSPVQCRPLASSERREKDGGINGCIPPHTQTGKRKKYSLCPGFS